MVAIAAILAPMLTSGSPSTAPSPDLYVDKVEIVRIASIDATSQILPGSKHSYRTLGSAIDITLRNNGAAPALIVETTFRFKYKAELANCVGAGPGTVSAEYNVEVPTNRLATPRHPLIIHRDMRFIVAGYGIDRFRISLGPHAAYLSSWPWVYEFTLSLVEDNGQKLNLGQMASLGYIGNYWNQFKHFSTTQVAANRHCVVHDEATLYHAATSPGLHSPELTTMYLEAKSLVRG